MEAKNPTPEFFLYTSVNEGETKMLKKCKNNKKEREALKQIFNLDKVPPKILDLFLDFHYMNYQFAKEENFTNEKISTLLGIFNHTLHYSLENRLTQKECLQQFKDILTRHSTLKPPDNLQIFTLLERRIIERQFLQSFYRHFPLYEYAFKPRTELSLLSFPHFTPNLAQLPSCGTNADTNVAALDVQAIKDELKTQMQIQREREEYSMPTDATAEGKEFIGHVPNQNLPVSPVNPTADDNVKVIAIENQLDDVIEEEEVQQIQYDKRLLFYLQQEVQEQIDEEDRLRDIEQKKKKSKQMFQHHQKEETSEIVTQFNDSMVEENANTKVDLVVENFKQTIQQRNELIFQKIPVKKK